MRHDLHAPEPAKLQRLFNVTLNHNQTREIARLFYEITRRDKIDGREIIARLRREFAADRTAGKNTFSALKRQLIRIRFPLTSAHQHIAPEQVYLPRLYPARIKTHPPVPFIPAKILVDRQSRGSYLAERIRRLYPRVSTEEITSLKSYLQSNPFGLEQMKQPTLFLLREHGDFIKPCPCTPEHIRCNYWIFNLGFGCPFDCSYCFLQQYTNTPGILLPSNLDDFFSRFDAFIKKFTRPIRIGTGEFCDSLALDHITGYSTQLIEFFRDKPVLFELKTKSDNIANLLTCKPAANVIISWSLNPQTVIDREEFGAACLADRLRAAAAVQKHGFSVSFHFDPVIYFPGWEDAYADVVDQLYQHVTPPLRWISLGTLRGTRTLKTIAERRFPESSLWFGELLLGKDKKLRYAPFLREHIYPRMTSLIRRYDPQTPLYLCMEDERCWKKIVDGRVSPDTVETSLLGRR